MSFILGYMEPSATRAQGEREIPVVEGTRPTAASLSLSKIKYEKRIFKMATEIYCRATAKGIHSFYIRQDGKTHFLFSQNYRRGVNNYYYAGVRIDDAIDFSRAGGDDAILRTMKKLPSHIRYVEREYGITVLRKTAERAAQRKKHVA